MEVEGRYKVQVSINGLEIPNTTMISDITIIEAVNIGVPTLDLSLTNGGDFIESNAIFDGAKVDLSLTFAGYSESKSINMKFVLMNHQVESLAEGFLIKLHCFLDVPDFFEARIEQIRGSSFEVFNQVAVRNGLIFEGTQTTDTQCWIRPGIRGNLWLQQIANYAYRSPTSVYVNCLTKDGVLKFIDLDTKSKESKPNFDFVTRREKLGAEVPSNAILYKNYRVNCQSGLLNTVSGYGKTLSNFNVCEGVLKENKPKIFNKRTTNLQVNLNREKSQRFNSLGFNGGNVHENYHEAFAQNQRLKSLYSTMVTVASDFPRQANLLDRVNLLIFKEEMGPSGEATTTHKGIYFVSKIVTNMNQMGIASLYTLVREGDNAVKSAHTK